MNCRSWGSTALICEHLQRANAAAAPPPSKRFRSSRPIQMPFFTKVLRTAQILVPSYVINPRLNLHPSYIHNQCQECCDWPNLPPELDPGGAIGTNGQSLPAVLPAHRIHHKREQITNVTYFALPFIRQGLEQRAAAAAAAATANDAADVTASTTTSSTTPARPFTVVDFCCGSGWQTLPLAQYFPNVSFVLIDSKQRSLDVARERATRAKLNNVRTVLLSIEHFQEPFDLGIALHACGPATDIAMELCVQTNADFVMIPCCVGKVQQSASYLTTNDTDTSREEDSHVATIIQYPRSKIGREQLTREGYDAVAKAADFGHREEEDEDKSKKKETKTKTTTTKNLAQWREERRACKSLVEHDRALACIERGYKCWLSIMEPKSCSPKNDVIVGRAPR